MTPQEPKQPPSRPDFTQALVHFTRPRNGSARHWEPGYSKNHETPAFTAFDVLKEIYTSGVLRGSTTDSGFIKGSTPAACFSEVPLGGIRYFAGDDSRYKYYGVAVSKTSAFGLGARPVIYLPDKEGAWIPAEERWRHVRYDPPSVDLTWEREWRAKGDFDLRKVKGCYFFVWSPDERRALQKLKFPGDTLRGVLCMEHLFSMI